MELPDDGLRSAASARIFEPAIYMLLPLLEPGDVTAAQAALKLLKGGDTKSTLAAAIAVATQYAKGYRIEYADAEEGEPRAEPVVVVPPMGAVRR